MVKPALKHTLEALLVLVGVVVALAAALALRLAHGPIALPGLRPAVEHALAKQVEGGKARVGEANLVWFADTQALGVRLKDVDLRDGQNRPVLRAAEVEGAVALDSALVFSPAPGRLAARDFFAAVSVSPQGRYALGYDAKGAPEQVGGLDHRFVELIGEAKRGRPLSYLRDVNLTRGRLAFRESQGPVHWTGHIDRVAFRKADGRITSDCRVAIDDGERRSTLALQAKASVGLKDARVTGQLANLIPARVFPAVGGAKPLSALDALVQGRGTLDYAASRGVTAADGVFTAGAGRLRFGKAFQRFDSAEVAGGFDPATGEVKLTRFKVAAERTRLDVRGRLKLIPEKGGEPARIAFGLEGPDGLMTLAPSAAPQPVQDLVVRGVFTPEEGRLAFDEARVKLAGAPIAGKVAFQRSKKAGEAWGITASARIEGTVGPEQIFAFWPEGLGQGPRHWLKTALRGGRVHDVSVMADIKPGAIGKDALDDKALRVEFTGEDLELVIWDQLPPLTGAVGHGVLQGNRLDITMPKGRILDVALDDGVVEIPRFKPKGARAVFKVHGVGEARQVLQIVDTPHAKLLSNNGFDPARVSGQADVRFEMSRPMLSDVPIDDYEFHYGGRIRQAGLKQAAIGLDLHDADLAVDGDIKGIDIKGNGLAGPYHGAIAFNADFKGRKPMTVDLDGSVDVAGAVAGAGDGGAPFKAKFQVQKGEGRGEIHSRPLEGKVAWSNDRRVVVEGVSQPAGWQQAGVPISSAVGNSFPVKLTLNKAGTGWNGVLDADCYSGAVAWTAGDKPRLRYTADITPEEARKIGLGVGGAFARTQPVSADVVLNPVGSANYAVGPMNGRVEWAMTPTNTVWRWKALLTRADLIALGAPSVIDPTAPVPIDVSFTAANGGLAGDMTLAGAAFKVAMTSPGGGRKLVIFSGSPSDAALERLGVIPQGSANGVAGVSGRLEKVGSGGWSGHVEGDLTRLALAIPDTDWRKPAGKAARAYADFTARADGGLSLERLVAQGPGLDVQAQGLVAHGQLVSLSTKAARIDGVYDGALTISRDERVMVVRANGKFVDTRPILKKLSTRPSGNGAGGGPSQLGDDPWRVEAQFERARVTDVGVLRDVKVTGSAGRVDVAAATPGGSTLSLKMYPEDGGTAFTAKFADVSQVAEAFFGDVPLKGGSATAVGRLAEDGFDAVVEMHNVRAVRVPAMGQLLTVASLRGLADTMNGDGIVFTQVNAPIRVRGSKVYLDDARASGAALGITAKGVIDLNDRVMDLNGALAPAYALNSAVANVPVLGALLTSRKGEGVVGLTYTARGAVKTPKVSVNPLSLAAPGILRRMFEPVSKKPARQAEADGPVKR